MNYGVDSAGRGPWWSSARRYVVTADEWENRCRWEDLTAEEKILVCDGGCGLSIFGKKIIPDILFRDCCCHHDFAFLRGGDERVRNLSEYEFRNKMEDIYAVSPDPAFFKWWAIKYKTATQDLGWLIWRYGPMRNKAEILALAAELRGA